MEQKGHRGKFERAGSFRGSIVEPLHADVFMKSNPLGNINSYKWSRPAGDRKNCRESNQDREGVGRP